MTTAELRALLAAATPRPWASGIVGVWSDGSGGYVAQGSIAPRDRALMVALVNAAPALLDRLDRMERLLRGLEWSSMESCRHPFDAKDRHPSGSCPECCGTQWWDWQTSETLPQGGHAPGCELAALLAEAPRGV